VEYPRRDGQEGLSTGKGERKKQARVGGQGKREEEEEEDTGIVFSLGRVPLLLETMSSERALLAKRQHEANICCHKYCTVRYSTVQYTIG